MSHTARHSLSSRKIERGAAPEIRILSDIEARSLDNKRLHSGLRYLFAFPEVDGADAAAVQTCVEEFLRVLQPGALRERQPYGVLEHFTVAYDAVDGPHGHTLWP